MARKRSHVLTTRLEQRISCTAEPARLVRQQLGADGGPLMPEAADGQHELEAALLVAISRASKYVAQDRGVGRIEPIVRQVRLATHALWLEVVDDAVERLLEAALPSLVDSALTGIPGLRPRPTKDHLDLVLIGRPDDNAGTVRLQGVDQARWRSAARRLNREFGAECSVWMTHPNECSAAEQQTLRGTTSLPTELMSAVLRRYPLWRRAAWLDSAVEGEALRMRWEDGHADTVVTEILARSASCIPEVSITRKQVSNRVREILMSFKAIAAQPVEPALRSAVVPDAVWDGQQMREALGRRDIGSVYQLLRRQGVSKRQLSALTGQTQHEVTEILQGHQVSDYVILTRIAVGLGVPRRYVGLAYDEKTASAIAAKVAAQEDESVKRRKFLAHAAAVTVGAAVFGAASGSWVSNSIHLPVPAPAHIGMSDVRQLEATTRALRALDFECGPGSCRDAVTVQLSWGQQMLLAKSSKPVGERLRVALADLRSLAGGPYCASLRSDQSEEIDELVERVRRRTNGGIDRLQQLCDASSLQVRDGEMADWIKRPTIKSVGGILVPVASMHRLPAHDLDLHRAS